MTKDIVSGFICLLFIAICAAILIYLRYKAKKNEYDDYWYYATATEIVLGVCAAVAVVILFIAICLNIYDYIMWSHFPSMRFLDHIANMSN
jgi:heme/copper-type cytochrome/quinol oxidase subunit 2